MRQRERRAMREADESIFADERQVIRGIRKAGNLCMRPARGIIGATSLSPNITPESRGPRLEARSLGRSYSSKPLHIEHSDTPTRLLAPPSMSAPVTSHAAAAGTSRFQAFMNHPAGPRYVTPRGHTSRKSDAADKSFSPSSLHLSHMSVISAPVMASSLRYGRRHVVPFPLAIAEPSSSGHRSPNGHSSPQGSRTSPVLPRSSA